MAVTIRIWTDWVFEGNGVLFCLSVSVLYFLTFSFGVDCHPCHLLNIHLLCPPISSNMGESNLTGVYHLSICEVLFRSFYASLFSQFVYLLCQLSIIFNNSSYVGLILVVLLTAALPKLSHLKELNTFRKIEGLAADLEFWQVSVSLLNSYILSLLFLREIVSGFKK